MQTLQSHSLFSLDGRTVLVTGAAGHLGRALCDYLVGDGATVLALDVETEGLEALHENIKPKPGLLYTLPVDLSKEADRATLVPRVSAITESIDGAVFSAALVGTSELRGWAVEFSEQAISSWRDALEVNLTAPFHLSQLLTPLLARGMNPSIVNIGSIYGSLGPDWSLYTGLEMSNPAAYAVSKGGVAQLTRWLSTALAPDIRVNCVSPGGILRGQPPEFVDKYSRKTPLGRMAEESDIVGAVAYFLSEAARYSTGQNLLVDGGYASQ